MLKLRCAHEGALICYQVSTPCSHEHSKQHSLHWLCNMLHSPGYSEEGQHTCTFSIYAPPEMNAKTKALLAMSALLKSIVKMHARLRHNSNPQHSRCICTQSVQNLMIHELWRAPPPGSECGKHAVLWYCACFDFDDQTFCMSRADCFCDWPHICVI